MSSVFYYIVIVLRNRVSRIPDVKCFLCAHRTVYTQKKPTTTCSFVLQRKKKCIRRLYLNSKPLINALRKGKKKQKRITNQNTIKHTRCCRAVVAIGHCCAYEGV